MYKFKFADIGEGLHEGIVGEIFKNVGDKVAEGDSLFTIETDKVNSEIPAPATGIIAKVLIAEGDTIHVGDEVYYIDDGTGAATEAPKVAAPALPPKAEITDAPKTTPQAVTAPADEAENASVVGEVTVSNEVKTFPTSAPTTTTATREVTSGATILATPLARRLARSKGIDITQLSGSGPRGRVLMKDVEANQLKQEVKATPKNLKAPVLATTKSAQRETIKPMRKAIAKAMKNSWANVAYTNLVNEVNMTELWNLRQAIKEQILRTTNVKLTFLPYIAKAVTIALGEFPLLGAKYDEQAGEIVYPTNINLGIAVDTEAGLMVPVVARAEQLSILDLAKEINTLAQAARKRTITIAQMSGGTFSITNYGSVGAMFGVPVINYPELAIAGVGAIIDRPVVENGQIVAGKIMNLTVAADHRWIDGATIGRFAYRIKQLLENPSILGVY